MAVAGLPLLLAPPAALMLNLAFHELATNAAKYGALSVPGGRVEIGWAVDRADRKVPVLEIAWRERGGPPVRPPARRGFGSRLVERALAREFGAEVKLDFAPGGVECRIRLPFAAAIAAG